MLLGTRHGRARYGWRILIQVPGIIRLYVHRTRLPVRRRFPRPATDIPATLRMYLFIYNGFTGWWPSSSGTGWTGRWCACPSGPSASGVRSRWNSRWPAARRRAWPATWPTGWAPAAAASAWERPRSRTLHRHPERPVKRLIKNGVKS